MTNEAIIDTNVAIVANGQNNEVSDACVESCVNFLITVRNAGRVILDSADEVKSEYIRALRKSRPYGLGAQFLFYIFQNQGNPEKVRIVDLERLADGSFTAFPNSEDLASFDQSDRKFAALSIVTGVPVTNAVDSDWANSRDALAENGVHVQFLCGIAQSGWWKTPTPPSPNPPSGS